jgi:hypothetical protein
MLVPPSYEDAVNEEIFLGKIEDLDFASTLVPHSRVYAALRPSEDSMNIARVRIRFTFLCCKA